MSIWSLYKNDFRENLKLAVPIMIGQLGQITVNLVDALMVGRLGTASLAAASLSISVFVIFMVFGVGITFALPPLVSEAVGADRKDRIPDFVGHSLLVNIGFAILSLIIMELLLPYLHLLGQDPEVVALAIPYLRISVWSVLPMMLFQTFRTYADGMSETIPATIAIVIGNIVNIVFNYLLIFGKFGFDAMGLSGAALASLIARIVMFILIIIFLFYWKDLWSYIRAISFKNLRSNLFTKILKLGTPSAMQLVFEVSAFSAAAIIMGMVSKQAQAAHQIAVNLASTTFLICTGLGIAATVRVGNEHGRENSDRMRTVGFSAIFQVILFMAVCAILFLTFRDFLPHLYIDDLEVTSIAATLLVFAAIFQIPDGMQVVSLGALRGIQDVNIPTLITFIAYWLIGIPISYCAALYTPLAEKGVWLGLLIGLSASAILLTKRFEQKTR